MKGKAVQAVSTPVDSSEAEKSYEFKGLNKGCCGWSQRKGVGVSWGDGVVGCGER